MIDSTDSIQNGVRTMLIIYRQSRINVLQLIARLMVCGKGCAKRSLLRMQRYGRMLQQGYKCYVT
jgi:hypothetical protein